MSFTPNTVGGRLGPIVVYSATLPTPPAASVPRAQFSGVASCTQEPHGPQHVRVP